MKSVPTFPQASQPSEKRVQIHPKFSIHQVTFQAFSRVPFTMAFNPVTNEVKMSTGLEVTTNVTQGREYEYKAAMLILQKKRSVVGPFSRWLSVMVLQTIPRKIQDIQLWETGRTLRRT